MSTITFQSELPAPAPGLHAYAAEVLLSGGQAVELGSQNLSAGHTGLGDTPLAFTAHAPHPTASLEAADAVPVNATRFLLSFGDPLLCLYLHLNQQYHLLITQDGGLVPLTYIPAAQSPTGQDMLAFPVGIGPSAPSTTLAKG